MKINKKQKAQHVVVRRIGTPQYLWFLSRIAQIFLGLICLFLPFVPTQAHPGSHDAFRSVNERLEKKPESIDFLLQRAALHLRAGHIEEAQADVHRIRGLAEGSFEFESFELDALQIQLHRVRGEYEDAEGLLEQLRTDYPQQKGLLFKLIEVKMDRAQWGEAERMFREWMDSKAFKRPEQAMSLLMRFKHAGEAEPQRAYRLLDKTIEKLGYVPLFIDTKVKWLVEAEQFEEALVLMQQLYRQFPMNLDFATRYALLLERVGNASEAQRVYQDALARYAGLPESRKKAPARLKAVAHLREGLERTEHEDK